MACIQGNCGSRRQPWRWRWWGGGHMTGTVVAAPIIVGGERMLFVLIQHNVAASSAESVRLAQQYRGICRGSADGAIWTGQYGRGNADRTIKTGQCDGRMEKHGRGIRVRLRRDNVTGAIRPREEGAWEAGVGTRKRELETLSRKLMRGGRSSMSDKVAQRFHRVGGRRASCTCRLDA